MHSYGKGHDGANACEGGKGNLQQGQPLLQAELCAASKVPARQKGTPRHLLESHEESLSGPINVAIMQAE